MIHNYESYNLYGLCWILCIDSNTVQIHHYFLLGGSRATSPRHGTLRIGKSGPATGLAPTDQPQSSASANSTVTAVQISRRWSTQEVARLQPRYARESRLVAAAGFLSRECLMGSGTRSLRPVTLLINLIGPGVGLGRASLSLSPQAGGGG